MEWLGVDIGWVYPAADSDGRIHSWRDSRTVRRYAQSLPTAGPVTIRRPDGTVETQPAYDGHEYAEIANRREHARRCQHLANVLLVICRKSHRGLALENWHRDRRQRNWLTLYQELIQGARYRTIPVALVPAPYTSQTCPECGHVDPDNRPGRNWFACLRCGHEGQADVIAATNIAALASTPQARYLTKAPKITATERKFLDRAA